MNIRKVTALLGAATLAALTINVAAASASVGVIGSFGTSGPGTLKTPRGIAVSPSTGDVYVSDSEDNRVVEYDASGNFVLTFGEDVNQTKVSEGAPEAEENVCTVASGDTCTAGAAGTAPGQFHYPTGLAVNVTTGDVYVTDYYNNRIERFTASGEYVSEIVSGSGGAPVFAVAVGNQLAVDLEGNLYVLSSTKLGEPGVAFKFDAAGAYTGEIAHQGSYVAVDADGTIYMSFGNGVAKLSLSSSSSGVLAEEALVVGGGGKGGGALAVSLFDGGVFNGGTNGAGEDVIREYDSSGAEIGSFPAAQQSSLEGLAYGDAAGRLYELYSPALSEVVIYGEFPAPVEAPPSVGGESSSNAGLGSVTLTGRVDPNLLDTSYSFQYATDPQFDGATDVPAAGEDVGAGYLGQRVSLELSGLQQSTEYYYRIVAHNSFGGGTTTDGPTQTFTTLAPPPSVRTEAASEVSFNAATVNGTVTPGSSGAASDAMWCFEYGTAGGSGYDLGYLPGVPPGDAGQGIAPVPVSMRLTGLTPGESYRYRLVAVNSIGLGLGSTACGTEGGHQADGSEGMFTTSPVGLAPLVESGPAVAVSQTAVTLTGTVDPQGVRTVYSFQIGTDTGYGVELFGEAGSGSQPEAVSVLASYLQPGTTYHYRLVASNANGTVYGEDQSFTTPVYQTATLLAPVAPPLLATPRNAASLGGKASGGQTSKKQSHGKRRGKARRQRAAMRHRSRQKGKRAMKASMRRKGDYGSVRRGER